ncbi:MAG: DUF1800 domain-containing protein [Pseudomonadota bacterium]|nr:DUF1800 domain-containing protein [Pseudomonadota bacterium]
MSSKPAQGLSHACLAWLALFLLPAGCAAPQPRAPVAQQPQAAVDRSREMAHRVGMLDRLSFGINGALLAEAEAQGGAQAWLQQQLHPAPGDDLPPEVQARLQGFLSRQQPLEPLMLDIERRRKAARALAGDAERKQAQDALRATATRMGREAQLETLWRAVYSHQQLRELLTDFWANHFSVFIGKGDVPLLAADYVDHAIRPHVLGRFQDLLRACASHPAMLRYLDNDRNAAGKLNENFARELMELHTLGVDGGYTQKDVQELARALTGFGVWQGEDPPRAGRNMDSWRREGLLEYRPGRHDFGDKVLLGERLHSRGWGEFDEVITRLAHHPATIRHVSARLATFLLGHPPGAPLLDQLQTVWLASDGDLRELTLAVVRSGEFDASLGEGFKTPQRFVIGSIRLAYEDRVVLNLQPALNWLNRMQHAPFGHATPEGYALPGSAWNGPGQFATRFEIARQLGYGSAGLFRAEGAKGDELPAFPQLASAYYYRAVEPGLGHQTREALAQARSPQEWSLLLLASPEMMRN